MNMRTFVRQCQEAEVILSHALSSSEFDQFEPDVMESVLSKIWLQMCVDLDISKERAMELVETYYDKYSMPKQK